jgi:MFS family permease
MKKNLKIGLFVQLIVSGAPLMADLFIPQFAERLGATRPEIGVLGAMFALSMFVSSAFFGRISDIIGRKKVLFLGFVLSGLFYAASFFVQSFGSFFILIIFQGISIGIYPGALAAYVHESSGTMDDYAAYGALGIALFLSIGGLIAGLLNLRWIFIFVGILYTVSFLLVSGVKEDYGELLEIPLFPVSVIKHNIFLYLAVFCTFTGITMTWTYWVLFMKQVNASQFAVGYITMINPLTEFVVLKFVGNKLRFRSTRFGMLILALSYPVFALAKNPFVVVPLQIISGTGWAFMYAGSLNEIVENNKEKGTATGLLQSSISMGNIAGPFTAGLIVFLFKDLKFEFVFAGVIIFVGFLLLLKRDTLLDKEKKCKIGQSI